MTGMTKTIQIVIMAAALGVYGCSRPVANMPPTEVMPSAPDAPVAAPSPAADGQRPEPPAIEEPAGELALQTALALTLLHNPQLKSYALDIRIAEANQLQASLRPNPDLEFEAEEIGAAQQDPVEPGQITIALSQLIELGGKRQKRTRVGALDTQLAGMDYEARRLDVLTDVHVRFVDLLAAQQRLELTGRLEHLAEEAAGAVDALVEAGKDSPVERTRAQIQLSKVRTQRKQAEQNLDVARKALAALWGADDARFDKAVGDFETTRPIASVEALTQWIDKNPDVARWTIEIEQRQAALELEKARAVSDLTLGGGVQVLDEIGETAAVVGARIALPLFDRNQGGRLAAAHRLARADLDSRATRIRIETMLKEAHRDAANALIRIDELTNHVLPDAQALFDAAQDGYRAGKFGYLHLLDAQRTLSDARMEYVDAMADYHKARAALERLIGGDVEQREINPADEACEAELMKIAPPGA